ncbi:MAG: hypothetical protein B6245_07960 [Desulfobacteraceae bacterium 4572_88]|nr:MAG: hypothetical protein B6245_07960 [Desulfobacteraceae bacterium 4572_88]RLC18376.1 MAG: single-stranded DNA-binding protein [Deltaproteobacteria bacterium]
MAGYCKISLIGNLGGDPEVRYTPDGLAVTNFNLAVTERVKGVDKTQWYRVTAFGKLGEICGEYLSKGKQVYVEGRLQTSEWEDRDGNKRFNLEVIASVMKMLGTKADNYDSPGAGAQASGGYNTPAASPPPPSQSQGGQSFQSNSVQEDDVPF